MGLNDFLQAVGRVGSRGKGGANSAKTNAHVSDFNRNELENASRQYQQPEPGALGTFLDNLGSFFRPAGTLGAATYDAIGGEGALTRDIGALRKGSELYRGSDFQKGVKSIPIVGDIVDTGLRAPTGDFSKTLVGQGIDKVKELFTGVNPTNQDIFSDLSKTRIAHATEDSGFNDVARSIAANRQGQKQDNFVERTLGKLPVAGAYFDKLTPSVEDRAIEAGATPEQAAFISMLNPLEWLNAESKTDAAAKLEKAGTFRKALNRIASPVVDPLQAGLDWALPGKAKAVSQGGEIPSAPVVEAKPLVENAPTDAIRQAFANNLGVDVNALPLEQVAEAARPVIDDAAKPVLQEAQAAPVRPSTDAVIAPSSPVDDFVKAIAPTEAPLPSEAVQEAAAPVVEDAVKPIDYTPAPFEAAKPLVDEAPPAPVQSVPPAIAAARAALNDPNIGDAVDALDEAAPTIALEKPSSRPLTLTEKIDTVVNAVADNVRRGAEPGTSIDIATKPVQKAAGEAAKADVDRLAALEKSIEAVKNSDLPPTQRRRKLAALQQEVIALSKGVEEKALPPRTETPVASAVAPETVKDQARQDLDLFFGSSGTSKIQAEIAAKEAAHEAEKEAKWGGVRARTVELELKKLQRGAEDLEMHRAGKVELSPNRLQNLQRWEDSGRLSKPYLKRLEKELASLTAPRAFKGTIQLNAGIIPSEDQLRFLADSVKGLAKKFGDNTVELRASLSRWFSSTSLGKVDAKTTAAIRDGAEASDAYSRTLADAYHKAVNGDFAGIIGSKHGGVYALNPAEKSALNHFMAGRVDESALHNIGLPQDAIEVSKLVRQMMDKTSDSLMSETFNLPAMWFHKLNGEERSLVAELAKTASSTERRGKLIDNLTGPGPQLSPERLAFLSDAAKKVDDGFAELNAAGHWLDGENPTDMLLHWAPYLANRGTYQPLLYRLFEHGVLSKGDDAMQLYISTLKSKGVTVPPEVEAFLYTNWMAGGAGKANGSELARLKARNPNMPQALKELLQEIEDPAYSYATGIFQANRLRNQLTLRRWMADQSKYVSLPGESAVDFAKRTGYDYKEFVQLGDNVGANSKTFGAMKDRLIHRDFWDLAYQVHALPGTQNGVDMMMQFNKEVMQRWKFWHTVANPASHIRQGVQNFWSIWLAGGNRAVANLYPAVKEYRERGALYAMAKNHGILGNKSLHDIAEKIDDSAWKHLDFNAAESFMARFGKFGEAIAKTSEGFRVGGGKKAAAAWQYVDEVARMALLKTYVDRGWPVKEAAEAVKGEIYGGVKRSRFDLMLAGVPPHSTFADLGAQGSLGATAIKAASVASQMFSVPFWGATRFTLEQTLRNVAGMKPGTLRPFTDPGRMARTAALGLGSYWLFQKMKEAEGLEPADEVNRRPDYMRPYVIPMQGPVSQSTMQLIDDKGKVGYVDWSWMFPWGNLAQQGFNPRTGSMEWRGGIPSRIPLSPLLQPIVDSLKNNDSFREDIGARAEIYSPLDTNSSKARKSAAHVWRTWLPPWAPNLAGGFVDAIRADGGRDGHVDAKERMRAFMQGVAMDSGHTASKLASGIYNSFDFWWNEAHPDGQERLQVSDYMGREQYLVKAIADALALKITSTDMKQIEKRRQSARTKAIAGVKDYYQQQRSYTTNPTTIQRLRREEAEKTLRIKQGKPVPQWYDEAPADTWQNVENFFAGRFGITTSTPSQ